MLQKLLSTHQTAFVVAGSVLFTAGVIGALLLVDWLQRPMDGEPLTIAVPDNTSAALVYLAQEKGFFQDEGLDVTLDRFTSGHLAIDDILPQRARVAVSVDVPVVYRSFEATDFVILASVATSDQAYAVVARADRGIATPGDLAGRVLATEQGGSAHYFLDALLEDAGLVPSDVEIEFMEPDEALDALREGQVDAVSTLESVAQDTADELGEGRGVVLGDFGRHRQYTLLLATRQMAEQQDEALEAVLRALVRAERYLRGRPVQARAAIARELGMTSTAALERVWSDHRFQVSASFGTLISLEDQADWISGLLPDTEPPPVDFFDLFYVAPLREVRPAAVGVWN